MIEKLIAKLKEPHVLKGSDIENSGLADIYNKIMKEMFLSKRVKDLLRSDEESNAVRFGGSQLGFGGHGGFGGFKYYKNEPSAKYPTPIEFLHTILALYNSEGASSEISREIAMIVGKGEGHFIIVHKIKKDTVRYSKSHEELSKELKKLNAFFPLYTIETVEA